MAEELVTLSEEEALTKVDVVGSVGARSRPATPLIWSPT